MKISRSLIVFLQLATSPALAEAPFAPMPEKFRFTSAGRDRLEAHEVREVATLAQTLVSLGLEEIDVVAGNGEGLFGVDQVFWNPRTRQTLFLKLDLAPEPRSLQGRVLAMNQNYLYHGRLPSGLSYLLYFENFTSRHTSDTLAKIHRALAKLPTAQNSLERGFHFFFPSAHAGDEHRVDRPNPPTEEAQGAARDEPPVGVAQRLAACGKGLGQAAYDSTVGFAKRVGRGAIKVVKASAKVFTTPPRETLASWGNGWKRFWGMLKSGFRYVAFDAGRGRRTAKMTGIHRGLQAGPATTAPPAAAPGPSAYEKLSPADKTKFVCRLAGTVGVIGVTWMFLPGNVATLTQQVGLFEAGRTVAQDVDHKSKAEEWDAKYRRDFHAQVNLSEAWARDPRTRDEANEAWQDFQRRHPEAAQKIKDYEAQQAR